MIAIKPTLSRRVCRLVVSVLFIVSAGPDGYGQTKIEGVVKDSLGKPVVNANIYIQAPDEATILAYTYSNLDGSFLLDFDKTGTFILNVSSLSYKTEQIPLDLSGQQGSGKLKRHIILQSHPFSLSEVVINADIPILVKKDTIIINPETFIDGSEVVLEDVLRKLPGIEVSADGNIQVQGKNVEKVLVEGDDLFEKGYKLLTKNLSASVLDKVEILEHYSDNALLKGLEDSEKVALNLTLKDEARTQLFGNSGLGYGNGQFYEAKLNLISFMDKTKYYFLGNLNNTGTDVTGDIYQLLYPDLWSSDSYTGDGENADQYISLANQVPVLKESRVNFNNAELASLNGIYNPLKNLKIKGLLFYTSDENDFVRRSMEQFTVPPDSFINTESYRLRKISTAVSVKWDARLKLGTNAQLEYTGRYSTGQFRDKSQLDFNSAMLRESLLNKTTFTDQRLTYTQKLTEKSAIEFTGRYIRDSKPQEYQTDQVIFSDLFPSDNKPDFAEQSSRNSIEFMGLEGKFHKNGTHGNTSIDMGYSATENQLKSQLRITDTTQNKIDIDQSFTNPLLRFRLGDLYAKLYYKFTVNSFSIKGGIALRQLFSRVTTGLTPVEQKPLTCIPSLGIGWEIDKKNRVLTSYSYSTDPVGAENVYPGYILTSFRDFTRGLGEFRLLKGSAFLASYMLGNWKDAFLMNATFIYNRKYDYLANALTIQQNYNLSTPLLLKNSDYYTIDYTSDVFINPFSSNLKLKGGYSYRSYEDRVNESGLRMVETRLYTYGMEMRSSFEGTFNFHSGTEWTIYSIGTSVENSNTDNTSFLDLNFKFTDTFQFQFRNELYTFGSLPQDKSYYFSDLNLRYTLWPNKVLINLDINNLWNTQTFSSFRISDTGSYSSSYKLLPRYFLLKMEYRF